MVLLPENQVTHEQRGFLDPPCIDLDIMDKDPAAQKIIQYIDDSFFKNPFCNR
jgi:hypothetical protein